MKLYTPSAVRVWNLPGSGEGTAISASGNSDPNGWNTLNPSGRSNVDLRDVADVWLAVTVSAIGASTTLQVQLDVYDYEGNLYPAQLQLAAAISAPGSASIAGGLHIATKPLVLPEWGRVSWTVTGTGGVTADISLYGR